ncbi:membrane protein insertion efficiency factor YidD [Candidatus Pelagibacter sp.]|nr:membrane protein insertion efficiency factor YidD [Candidatus Pelagibacter sp.]
MKVTSNILIGIIKIYRLFISPYIGNNCRYLPTCSEYFIDSLKIHGTFKGSSLGIKRILSCHPIKFLGGGEGFDPVIKKIKGKNNGY